MSLNSNGGLVEGLLTCNNNPGGANEIYKCCINRSSQFDRAEIRFPLSVTVADRDRYTTLIPNNGTTTSSPSYQVLLSKVVLGRVKSDEYYRLFSRDTNPANGDYHSEIKINNIAICMLTNAY